MLVLLQWMIVTWHVTELSQIVHTIISRKLLRWLDVNNVPLVTTEYIGACMVRPPLLVKRTILIARHIVDVRVECNVERRPIIIYSEHHKLKKSPVQANVTGKFQLPLEQRHYHCTHFPRNDRLSHRLIMTCSARRDFWLLGPINTLAYLVMSFLLINDSSVTLS